MARTLTSNRGAQAAHDYAWRAREQHRRTVRQIWDRGIRTRAAVAAELNRLAVPSDNGRPWGVASAGRLLRQFGLGRVVLGREHAEAVREEVIELWGMGVQVPAQLAVALDRKDIPCPGGDRWTGHKAGRVLELLDGDWCADFGNVRLRRGDTIPEAYTIEVDEAVELSTMIELEAEAVAAPMEAIEAAEPIELEPREPRHGIALFASDRPSRNNFASAGEQHVPNQILTAEQLAQIRQDLTEEFGSNADWRNRVQDDYPDDERNGEASDILNKLEASVADITDEILTRYNALWTNDENEDYLHDMTEDWSQKTREVGFYSEPSSAQELVEEFVTEWEAKLAPPQKPKPRRRAIRS